MLTTLVGDKREGFRSFGIGPGGAMDHFAMQAANYLVGNDRESVLELGFSAAEIQVHNGCLACVTGKGFSIHVDNEVFPLWKPFKVRGGSILKLMKTLPGAWAYLAVHGGWKAQEWLGSPTTNLSAKAGGFNGKALQKNDVVESNKNEIRIEETKALSWGISTNELSDAYSSTGEVRCILSIETDLLSPASKDKFISEQFAVSSQSNRMGYRMQGPSISLSERIELISSPVDFGTIQLLPDGNLVILMADHQTTGGYPRIASVIKADLPKLAQGMPGEKIKFKMISLEEARAESLSREQKIAEIKKSCHDRFKKYFAK